MKISVKVTHNWNNKQKTIDVFKLKGNIKNQFNIIGKELVKKAIASMKSSKSGVLNPRLGTPRSARGEALADDFGDTSKSIKHKVNGDRYMDFGGNTKQLAIWEGDSTGKFNNRPTLLNQVNKFDSTLKDRLEKKGLKTK